jgi:hypothetical protein
MKSPFEKPSRYIEHFFIPDEVESTRPSVIDVFHVGSVGALAI